MTLDSADRKWIMDLVARQSKAAVGQAARGGLAVPVYRPGTVASSSEGEVQVKVDGDVAPISALNLTSRILDVGTRVFVTFVPPHGVFVTHVVSQTRGIAYDSAWTGTVSDPTIGTGGAISAVFTATDKWCDVLIYILIGTGFADGGGSYDFGLPFVSISQRRQALRARIVYNGQADYGAGAGVVEPASATVRDVVIAGTSTGPSFLISPGSPGFAAGDYIIISGRYEFV